MALVQQTSTTSPIPRDKSLESTLALLADPYRFIHTRCARYQTNVFQARIMLQTTLCMSGREAAEFFFDTDRFQRRGAPPGALQKTLLGRGGVQELDDEAHDHRKQLFVDILSPSGVKSLVDAVSSAWHAAIPQWEERDQIILYDEFPEILCRAVFAWADVPLPETEVALRTRQLTALFNSAGSKGPGHLWARLARWQLDRWAANIIEKIRSGALTPRPGSAAEKIARHRNGTAPRSRRRLRRSNC